MKKIDKARRFMNLGVREMERQSGIAAAQWSRWLNKKQSPSVDSLENAAAKTGLDPIALITAFIEKRDAIAGNSAEEAD